MAFEQFCCHDTLSDLNCLPNDLWHAVSRVSTHTYTSKHFFKRPLKLLLLWQVRHLLSSFWRICSWCIDPCVRSNRLGVLLHIVCTRMHTHHLAQASLVFEQRYQSTSMLPLLLRSSPSMLANLWTNPNLLAMHTRQTPIYALKTWLTGGEVRQL